MTNILTQITSTIKHWRSVVFLGSLLVVVSVFVFMTPEASYLSLAVLFSALMLANGLTQTIFSIKNRKNIKGYGYYLVGGLIDLALGTYLAFNMDVTMGVLPFLVSFWFVLRSIQTFQVAYEIRKIEFSGKGWLIALGIVLGAIGVIIAMNPVIGAAYLVAVTGIAIFTMGVGYIVFGLKLRKVRMVAKKVKSAWKDAAKDAINNIAADLEKNNSELNKEPV